jgi:hypothetical protein
MGTRGHIRIVAGKRILLQYNQFDSNRESLGAKILRELIELLKTRTIDELIELFQNITTVSEESEPSIDEIKSLECWSDFSVSNQSERDWYCLLRKCQGSIKSILQSGYCCEYKEPTTDEEKKDERIFIEYIYTIDLNDETFTVSYYGNKNTIPLSVDDLKRKLEAWNPKPKRHQKRGNL